MSGNYRIVMKTPLGKKHGRLSLLKDDKILTGFIDILGHRNEIRGVCTGDKFIFTGELVTPIRKIFFFADGEAKENAVRLLIHADKNDMPVSGEIEMENARER